MNAANANRRTAGRGQAGEAAPAPLPRSRAELLALHRELRHRRDAAPLGSRERAEAMAELGRVEVEVARVERAMDPPLV
ncbi:MAG TPA: hypothetical protein VJ506_11605 [Candidatus Limnocylindrales bacterium]|nr:hypothetical protein [Candidatus Limnocylindrales bacterium]